MLTCKQFLHELNDYLDPNGDPDIKRRLESHVTEWERVRGFERL